MDLGYQIAVIQLLAAAVKFWIAGITLSRIPQFSVESTEPNVPASLIQPGVIQNSVIQNCISAPSFPQ